ncbi:complement C1s subcomponent-like [Lissotriton helveticus]
MRAYIWLLSVFCITFQGSDAELFGTITSPGYPAPYLSNQSMTWTVSVPQGYRLRLQFTHFDVGEDEEYCQDYVKVTDGSQTLIIVCGKFSSDVGDIPEPLEFISLSNTSTVTFVSRKQPSRHFRGFFAIYTALAFDECANSIIPCAHYCHSHPEGYFCSCAHGYTLGKDKASCEKTGLLCTTEVPSHAKQEPTLTKYTAGQVVNVTCLKGYEAVMPDKSSKTSYLATCKPDGQWSQYHHCQLMDCGSPVEIDNGQITYLSDAELTTYGAAIQINCTSVYYELNPPGDGVYHCSSDGLWKSKDGQSNMPECTAVCGFPSKPIEGEARVFGGSKAQPGNFPWQVFVSPQRGGGALISDEWVMTAAHVVDTQESVDMHINVTNLGKMDFAIQLTVKEIFIHPDWKENIGSKLRTNYNNDIALIRLNEKVTMNQFISPICLPGPSPHYGLQEKTIGYVSGWGRINANQVSDDLMKAPIPVVAMQNCKDMKGGGGIKYPQEMFTNNMVCAGDKLTKTDSCSGDSGGAYVFNHPDDYSRYYAGGIVSWGPPACGSFALYTKVGNYLQWIKDTMKKA